MGTSALIADLQHPDKNVRIDAALALGTAADPVAIPALLARLGTDPDFFVRENITWALVRMGDAAVLPLIDMLETGDRASRFNAAHTLSKLADPRAVPVLLATLDSSDAPLVQKAIYALGAIRDARALPALVARLSHDNGEARTTLHDALAGFGERAVVALVGLFADRPHDTAIRTEVVDILGSIGTAAVMPALTAALSDQAWEVRFAAVNALRRQDDPAVVEALHTVIDDTHPHVRLLARRAVQELT